MGEARVDASCWRNEPKAVRAKNAHEVRFRGHERPSTKLGAFGTAPFAEACGDDDDGASTAGAKRSNDLRNGWRRRGNDRKVGRQGSRARFWRAPAARSAVQGAAAYPDFAGILDNARILRRQGLD